MSQKEGAADPTSSPFGGRSVDMAAFEVVIFSGNTLVWHARLTAVNERAVRAKAFELMEQGGGYRPQLARFPREPLRVSVEALDRAATPWPEA